MSKLLLVSLFLGAFSSITACSTPRDYRQLTGQVGEYGVQEIRDTMRGVSCYVYRDADWSSLSCVPTINVPAAITNKLGGKL